MAVITSLWSFKSNPSNSTQNLCTGQDLTLLRVGSEMEKLSAVLAILEGCLRCLACSEIPGRGRPEGIRAGRAPGA